MTKFIFYRKASVFTGICSKKGKEKKHLHSYWVNIIYTINLRLFGHCICLKSSANVFWVIQKVFHLRCVASSCWCLNLWRLWNFQYLMNQNISALRTLGYVLKPCCLRETSAISHPSAGHHATFYNKTFRPLDSTASCLHNLLLRPSFIIQFVLNWADEQYFILVRFMLSKNKFYFLIFLKKKILESKTKLKKYIFFKSAKNESFTHFLFHNVWFVLFYVCAVNNFLIQIFFFFLPPQMKKCSPYQEKCWKGQTF